MKHPMIEIRWSPQPEADDYPAALSYLSLIVPVKQAKAVVAALRNAPVTEFRAKDIFRASGLSLLGVSNSHVERDREKIREGKKIYPLLLVRDPARGRVIIADGYHRLCAIYSYAEDALIRCQIVDLEQGEGALGQSKNAKKAES